MKLDAAAGDTFLFAAPFLAVGVEIDLHELQAETVAAPIFGAPRIGQSFADLDLEDGVCAVFFDLHFDDVEGAGRVVLPGRICRLAPRVVVPFWINESQRLAREGWRRQDDRAHHARGRESAGRVDRTPQHAAEVSRGVR